jgi:hypothetical protein
VCFGRLNLAVPTFGAGPHILEYFQDARNDVPHCISPPQFTPIFFFERFAAPMQLSTSLMAGL